MAANVGAFSGIIATFIILSFLCKPAHAFGAGNVADAIGLNEVVWKHGDIGDVLKLLPVSFLTRYGFTHMDIMRVYFGNWLRDYSQVIDIMPLSNATEPTLRAIVSLLGFMAFGLATEEFEVTKERLGCYRPEEHIDNPKGYALNKSQEYFGDDSIKDLDSRLRRKVSTEETDVDKKTGMKNYIANETLGINTSAGYVRRKIQECVNHGRNARRNGSESSWHEALISLGALLHTLEDFSAHSNYVELVLQCVGEKSIFACVGDKCRVTVPSTTQEVPPLVTGTFGSLDVFQSIIGEMDDKAAMKSEGELGALDNLLAGAPDFRTVAASIVSTLRYLSVLMPGAGDFKTELEGILKRVQDSGNDKAEKGSVDIDARAIWVIIEPVFSFQGKIKRFLIESKEHPQISLVTKALDKIGEVIDDLVYAALAVIIEPAVQQVREAIKDGKETIEKVDRLNKYYANIFDEDSTDSNPSHSILAKDHFSNYLNPVAGRVATATTNWATQRIVECWDSDMDEIMSTNTEMILEIFHHPAFALSSGQTFIQKTMFDIVDCWWRERTPSQQSTLRAHLNREGMEANADGHHHGDNNPVKAAQETRQFASKPGYALDWAGSKPRLEKRPEKDIGGDFLKILADMGETLEKTGKLLEEGAAKAEELINQGLDTIGEAADEVGKGFKRGFDEVTSTAEELAEEAMRGGKKVLDEATRAGQQVLDEVEETVGGAVDAVEETVGDIARGAAEVVTDLGNAVEKGFDSVVDTGGEVVRDVENFVSDGANEVVHQVEDFGNKAGEVFSDVGKALTSWW